MNRVFLFLGVAMPGALFAQPPGARALGENWPEVAAGGGRLFFALLAGMLLAFAFQWTLTFLSLAIGASAMGDGRRGGKRGDFDDERDRRGEAGGYGRDWKWRERESRSEEEKGGAFPARKIQARIGLWALATTGISLFLACWLASELLGFGGRAESIILGLAVWAGFLLTMPRLAASSPGSFLGSIVDTFKGGLQTAFGLPKALSGSLAAQAPPSVDAVRAEVREEFQSRGGSESIREKLAEYLQRMRPRSLDGARIEREADELFDDPEIREAAPFGDSIDRRRFQEIVASRSDLSPEEARMLTDTLQGHWQRLWEGIRGRSQWLSGSAYASSRAGEAGGGEARPQAGPALEAKGLEARGLEANLAGRSAAEPKGPAQGETAGRTFAAMGGPGAATAPPDFSIRFQGFKDFLQNAGKHDLNPARIEQEVEFLIVHPEEGRTGRERSAKEMKREEMVKVLRLRRDITLQEAESIGDIIDSARIRMLSRSEMREHRAQESLDKALSSIRDFVYSLKRPEMDYAGFQDDFARMLEGPQGSVDSLRSSVSGLDRDSLARIFAAGPGISRLDAERMAEMAEQALNAAREKAWRIDEETRRRMRALRRASRERAEATRKLAASAAWWLLAIATVSAAASALGGLAGAGA